MQPNTVDAPARAPRIAVLPQHSPDWVTDAVTTGGGQIVGFDEAEAVVFGMMPDLADVRRVTEQGDRIRWVQFPAAGIDRYVPLIDDDRVWTSARGVYADSVAEMALTLALAGMRSVVTYARATSWRSHGTGVNLLGANVTIFGGGGIGEALVGMLQPFGCRITVVRKRVQDMAGVDEVLAADRFRDALPGAHLVVLALALTPETDGIIGRAELEMMGSHAWLVNVGRGRHVVTDDLVAALRAGSIGGAALDVTDPEPLPDGHPLWSLPNCIITPHTANPMAMAEPRLSARIAANVRRFAADQELIGSIDRDLGY